MGGGKNIYKIPNTRHVNLFDRRSRKYKDGASAACESCVERLGSVEKWRASDSFPSYFLRAPLSTSCTSLSLTILFPGALLSLTCSLIIFQDPKVVRRVHHYHVTGWADKNIPSNPQCILDLMAMVEQSQRSSGNEPVVVQCRLMSFLIHTRILFYLRFVKLIPKSVLWPVILD